MMRILKNKKGMSLFEVVISITMLGVIVVPLMMLITTSVILANKNRDKVDLNYITEIIVEEVRTSVKEMTYLPEYSSYDSSINDYRDYTIDLEVLVKQSAIDGTLKSTDEIGVVGPSGSVDQFRTFSYKVEYRHSDCYDARYPETYEFNIYIYHEGKNVKRIKVPVWAKRKLHT